VSIVASFSDDTPNQVDVYGFTEGSADGPYQISVGGNAVTLPPTAFLFGSAILGLIIVGRREQA